MAVPSSSQADQADAPSHPPELSDADYFSEVLHQTDGQTDTDIEQALAAKAEALGVRLPISRCSTASEQENSSGAESIDTFISPRAQGQGHARTTSTSSTGTANTALTSQLSQNSYHSAVIPATLTESPGIVGRRRSRTLTFSHYEKYLSQLDPTLSQPKFLGSYASRLERSANTSFSAAKRRAVVKDLKRSITSRLRRRKPPPLSSSIV